MSAPDCPFCKKLADLDALEVVWRFPRSVAVLGPWQFYHGYCVLVSRTHAHELSALGDDERRVYLDEMCLLAKAIERAFVPHKLNYELLGNQVPHLHWHLFPRSAGDPARLSPVWLALDAAERDESARQRLQTGPEDRSATIQRLRESLNSLNAPPRMSHPLRLGTRGSPLALWQANYVAGLLRPLVAPRAVELILIETTGDRVRDRALSQIGGDGLFTKEIQTALLDGRADIAVHSLKDLPTTFVEGLTLACVPPRGPVGDAFVSSRYARFDELPTGATVATSSLRRRSQLLNRRPDLKIENLRGNVETRLGKLDEQGLDAIILAEAGLGRLRLADRITEILDRSWMLPAVGQGALGLECRTDDEVTRSILTPLNDAATRAAVLAERAFLRGLGGGCLVPIGSLGTVEGETLTLRGCVLPVDGARRIDGEMSGPATEPETVGRSLAEQLLERGARGLLARS